MKLLGLSLSDDEDDSGGGIEANAYVSYFKYFSNI